MRRLGLVILCLSAVALTSAPSAHAAFGLKDLDVRFLSTDGTAAMRAGTHPREMKTDISFNTVLDPDLGEAGVEVPDGSVKEIIAELPPGVVGDPLATPRCSGVDFVDIDVLSANRCANDTAVGTVDVELNLQELRAPVYNLAPPPGVAAKLGFVIARVPVTIDVSVQPTPPYRVVASVTGVSQVLRVYRSSLTIWGNPADASHDSERGLCAMGLATDCTTSGPARPFLTLPRSCTGPLKTDFRAYSWQNPSLPVFGEATTPSSGAPPADLGVSDCESLGFAPRIAAQPTSQAAESPTGLEFNLETEDRGLISPAGTAQSDIQRAVVSLPVGMTINPSQAEGLGVCSEGDLAREAPGSEFGSGCPSASKIGTVEVETPLLEGEVLKGSVFVARPFENRFGSLLAIYIAIKSPARGINVTLAGRVTPDPATGRLVTVFEDLPQLPFSQFRIRFRDGARSPLITPPKCGTYSVEAAFTPWARPSSTYTSTAEFSITRGVNGAPCPVDGAAPFDPGFEGGTLNNAAGAYSPFYMRLSRRDGDQDLTRFSSVLPPGVVGKLAGVSRCPDASIAAARGRSGRDELAAPSCPGSSEIGRSLAGAGVGSQLTYVGGKLYLAGPFNGAPLSVVAITPAVAGPFDIGTVVVREGLKLNPVTAEVTADGAHSDPIPRILAGIPVKLRDLRVYVDRDEFILNPTSCKPFEVRATLFGGGSLLEPAGDVPVSRASRFQAADCANLGFKPRLSLRLKGGMQRSDNPAFQAVLRPRPGDANLSRASLRLPHSAFLDQAHIRTICTRVQFAADACPKGSAYGRVTAFSPLLDEPLRGPVYLRSSSNPLPDLVFDLEGIVDVEAAARIDSVKGGIRATFPRVPDAPISKVVVRMYGGRKGLIVNSRNLCAHESRATVELSGHNGRTSKLRPEVKAGGCGGVKEHKRRARPRD